MGVALAFLIFSAADLNKEVITGNAISYFVYGGIWHERFIIFSESAPELNIFF